MPLTRITRRSATVLFATLAVLAGCDDSSDKPEPLVLPAPDVSVAKVEPIRPFNGSDFTGWKKFGHANFDKWEVGQPHFATAPASDDAPPALVQPDAQGVSIYTEREFGDCFIQLEAMVPAGGNSGIYIMGEYELQLLDDLSADADNPTDMDWGAIARTLTPRVYANKGGGVWQHIEIEFRAPRFDADKKKIANAKLVRVTINGQLIHENAEIPAPTAGGLYGEEFPATPTATGPLLLQGNEGPAAFRNIRITPR